jgi:tetrahydromethanopterin S-methyltransferase subunit B
MNELHAGISNLFLLMNEFMFEILAVSFGLLIFFLIKDFFLRGLLARRINIDGHNLIVKLATSKKESGQAMSYGEVESEVYSYTDKYDESIKVFIGSFTALGMIFTFIGLTFAVGKISDIIKNMEGSNFNNIVEGLSPVIGGMAIAFYSSLIGLILSLLFSLLNNHFKVRLDRKVHSFILTAKQDILPEYAPITTQTQVTKAFHTQQEQMKEFLTQHIKHTEHVLTGLSDNVNNSMEKLQSKNTDIFSDFSKGVHTSMQQLNTTYKDSYSIFTTVIDKLNTNIDSANANIIAGAETMKTIETEIEQSLLSLASNVEQFSNKVTSISQFSAPIEKSADKFESFTEEMLNSMDQFSAMLSGSSLKSDFRSIHVKLDAFDSLVGNMQNLAVQSRDKTASIESSLNNQENEISKIQTDASTSSKSIERALNQQGDEISKIQIGVSTSTKSIETSLNQQGDEISKIQTDLSTSTQSIETSFNKQNQEISKLHTDANTNTQAISVTQQSLLGLDEKMGNINDSAEDINQKVTSVNERVGLVEGKLDSLNKSKYGVPFTSKIPEKPKGSVSEGKVTELTKPENNKGDNKAKEKIETTSVVEKAEKPVKHSKWFGLGRFFNK